MNKRFLKHGCLNVFSLLIIGTTVSATAGGGGAAGGGSTEVTQIANNTELVAVVAKQADMVAEQIKTKLTAIDQLQTMMLNLRQLPTQVLAQGMTPYAAQISAFQELQSAVNGMRNAANNTRAMYEGRGLDFKASGLDPRKYIEYEVALAQRRGGVYRQRLDQDLAAMDALRNNASNLRSVAQRTSSIAGNVEGLQQLSQLSSMAAGELMEIKAAILAQNADRNEQAVQEQENAANRSMITDNSIKAARDRGGRNANTKVATPDSLRPWSNLEQPR